MESHKSESSANENKANHSKTSEDYEKEIQELKHRITHLEHENKKMRADIDFIFSKFPVFETKKMYDVNPQICLFDHDDVVGKTNLVNPSHFDTIINWFHVAFGISKLMLKYQATRDGFEQKNFRSHVFHQGPPLMFFFKAKGHDDIFGAYTNAVISNKMIKEDEKTGGAYDKHAFLFNLSTKKKYPCRDPVDLGLQPDEHNVHIGEGLITFGDRTAPDLHIGDKADKESSSICLFSNIFHDALNLVERGEHPELLSGTKNFELEEIEGFVVIASKYHL